jgi:methylglutaconyl-CoA hydratase
MTMNNLLVEINNPIATITLNRPEVNNAFNAEMIAELTETFTKISKDKDCHTVILQANGKNFCAGGDLNWMKESATYSKKENEKDAQKLADMLFALYNLPQTTIVSVKGAVYGGGVGLVSACDIALGIAGTTFCLSEVKLGLIPAVISPYVIEATSPRTAKRLFTTAEVINAVSAVKLGFLQNVYADEDILGEALSGMLRTLANNAPEARVEAKKLVSQFYGQPITEKTAKESAKIIAKRRATPEAQEGIGAFLEKRSPSWRKQ